MNNINRNYERMLGALQSGESRMSFLNQKCKPRLSDIELTRVNIEPNS